MSDRPADALDRLVIELREPITCDPVAKRRVMDAVRRAAAPAPRTSTVRRSARAGARLTSVAGVAIAAGLAGVITVGARASYDGRSDAVPAVHVIGDTVAATLRDTLRLVRFMLVAPAASHVALAGDFNRWNPRATPLHRASPEDPWSVALRLPEGRHTYAFVVNDTQWVRDPQARPAESSELAPPRSEIVVRKEN